MNRMIYFKYGDVVRFKLNTEEQGRQRCSGEPEQKKGGGGGHGSQPEDLSKRKGCLNKSPFVMHLREVVGDSNMVCWFLPILPHWNNRDELFGFCQPGSKLGRETKFKMLSRYDSEELPEGDDLEW